MKYLFFLLLLISQHGYSQDAAFTSFEDATKFFMRNIEYPQEVVNADSAGIVIVSVRLKDGEAVSSTIVYSENERMSAEVNRILAKARKLWKFIDKERVLIIPFEYYVTGVDHPYRALPELGVQKPALTLTPYKGAGMIVMKPVSIVTMVVCGYPLIKAAPIEIGATKN
jgi:hypothetical protein